MTISTIPTKYGTFTVTDNETDSISISGPASATFGYLIRPTPAEPGFTGDLYSGHAATLKAAFDFCLNYSREQDTFESRVALESLDTTHALLRTSVEQINQNVQILTTRGSDETLGIVLRNTCTPCITESALTLSALKESGKLTSVIKQIKSGETLEKLAGL